MTPTTAELHAEQLRLTLAAKLPTSIGFDVTHARLLAELKALLLSWQNPMVAPVAEVKA